MFQGSKELVLKGWPVCASRSEIGFIIFSGLPIILNALAQCDNSKHDDEKLTDA